MPRFAAALAITCAASIAAAETSTVVRGVVKDAAPVRVDKSLDASVIVRAVRGRIRAIKACYESRLQASPNLSGKLQVRFELSYVGKVASVEIEEDTIRDDELESCIRSRILTWRFPAPPSGSAQFSYPFVFELAKP